MKLKIGDLVRMRKKNTEIPHKTTGVVVELLETLRDGTIMETDLGPSMTTHTPAVRIFWGEHGTFWDTPDRLEKLNV